MSCCPATWREERNARLRGVSTNLYQRDNGPLGPGRASHGHDQWSGCVALNAPEWRPLEDAHDVGRRDDADEVRPVEDQESTIGEGRTPERREDRLVGRGLRNPRDRLGDLVDANVIASSRGNRLAVVQGHEAAHAAVGADQREGGDRRPEHEVVDQPGHGHRVGSGRRVRRHHVADAHPAEIVLQLGLLLFGSSGVEHEHPEDDQPQATQRAAERELDEAHRHQQPREDHARVPGLGGRREPVAGAVPQPGTQDASSVERRGRRQVEHGEHEVDHRDPEDAAHDQSRQRQRRPCHAERHTHDADRRAHRRTGGGNREIVAWRLGRALDRRDTPEHPQRDVPHRDAAPARDEGMAHLVRAQRDQEQAGRDERHRPVRGGRVAGSDLGEGHGREVPREQPEDDDDAPVEPQLDAGHVPDADAVHASIL